jgi:hypothetical protein
MVDWIRLYAIPTANDDGSQAASVSAQHLQQVLKDINDVYRAANIQFIFDPATDLALVHRSTLLNHDCTLAPDADLNSPPDKEPKCDYAPHTAERNRVARQYLDRLVLYFSSGDRPKYNEEKKKWEFVPRNFFFSNGEDSYVAMTSGNATGLKLAHEIGHYLHLDHPFSYLPKTVDEAIRNIRDYVEKEGHPKEQGQNVFDGDIDTVSDTPPDPGPDLFRSEGKNDCDINQGILTLTVNFSDGSLRNYNLQPDRENIMNYWDNTCRGLPARLSTGQAARVRNGLEQGNRNPLIAPRVVFDGIWEPTNFKQTRVLGWSQQDFAVRFDKELAQSRHVVHMQAYNISNGEIRRNGVWEAGDKGQSRALGWSFDDFVARMKQELAKGKHLVHMQAFDIGNSQIRWDGVWEFGNTGQSWVMGWSQDDFAQRFNDELAKGRHFIHMQAYNIGNGQIRRDGVWEAGDKGQSRALGWSQNDFAQRFNDELAKGKHVVHMQAYDIGNGQIRWDGVWEAGDKGQTRAIGWAFNDFVIRLEKEWTANRHLVHMQAYDMGNGEIRWDGVWEPGNTGQARALGFTLDDFAVRFDRELAEGRHVLQMQAYLWK